MEGQIKRGRWSEEKDLARKRRDLIGDSRAILYVHYDERCTSERMLSACSNGPVPRIAVTRAIHPILRAPAVSVIARTGAIKHARRCANPMQAPAKSSLCFGINHARKIKQPRAPRRTRSARLDAKARPRRLALRDAPRTA